MEGKHWLGAPMRHLALAKKLTKYCVPHGFEAYIR
jgi:hypothetical protein